MSDRRKVALVTGRAPASARRSRRLAADGYDVAVTGRRGGPIRRSRLRTGGLAIVADTGDQGAAERAVAETVARFGGLDALACNAGIGGEGAPTSTRRRGTTSCGST